jgi:hypothetical protein
MRNNLSLFYGNSSKKGSYARRKKECYLEFARRSKKAHVNNIREI